MTRTGTCAAILACFAAIGLLAASPAQGEEPAPTADGFAPFVNDQTIGVIAIDLASPGAASTVVSLLRGIAYREPDQAEIPTGIRKAFSFLLPGSDRASGETNARPRDGVSQVYLVVIWSDTLGFASDPLKDGKAGLEDSLFLVVPNATKEITAGLRELLPEPGKKGWDRIWACREINSSAVVADARLLDRLSALKAAPRPEFAAALAASGQSPVRISVAAPPLFARAAREILTSPAPGTKGPLGDYLAQIHWIGVGVNAGAGVPNLRLEMVLVPGSDKQRMLEFVGQVSQTLAGLLANAFQQAPADQAAAIVLPPATLEGDRIAWTLAGSATAPLAALGKELLAQSLAAEKVEIDTKLLKKIVTSLHNYHDVNKKFPDVAIRDQQGKPLLSWRVAVLPYCDQDALYKQFHLDEPWDSEHNSKLIDQMPDLFRGTDTKNGRTRFLAPVGERLAFMPGPSNLNLKSFSDGTVKTIMVIEVDPERAVVWTRPEELVVDLEDPKKGITDGKTNILAGFADGSAHQFKPLIRPEALRAFFTRNGGEVPSFNNIYPAAQ